MKKKEITRLYKELLENKHIQGEVEKNRINTYTCSCGISFQTIDIDKGVTSFILKCTNELCSGVAKSNFYSNNNNPLLEPIIEWYRPTLEEVLEKKSDKGWLDHVLQGGLETRTIEKSQGK